MKEMLKHFTVIEIGADSESPMVGTIDNVTNTLIGEELFKERLINALGEHFDSDDIHFTEDLPDLFTGSPYEDIKVEVDDMEYSVRILETWIY